MKVWEVATGRCMRTWALGAAALAAAWCPDRALHIVSAVTKDRAVLLPFGAPAAPAPQAQLCCELHALVMVMQAAPQQACRISHVLSLKASSVTWLCDGCCAETGNAELDAASTAALQLPSAAQTAPNAGVQWQVCLLLVNSREA